MIIWLLSLLYSILVIALPFEVTLGHFLPLWGSTLIMLLFVAIYNIFPGWTDIVVWVMYIIGFLFVFTDFPIFFGVIYTIVFVVLVIKTIIAFINNPVHLFKKSYNPLRDFRFKDNED